MSQTEGYSPTRSDAERNRCPQGKGPDTSLVSALRKERDLLAAILQSTQAQLAYLDPQFDFVRVNAAYVDGSGHSEEELVGHNHFDLFPSAENQAIFEQVRATGQPVAFRAKPFEFVDQPERGTTYWDWTLKPFKDGEGRCTGLLLSLEDVTERERAEQALQAALAGARQREVEMDAIVEGCRAILRHREFEAAAQAIFDSCKRLTGARVGYVALLSEDGKRNDVLFVDVGDETCAVDPALPMPIRGLRERVYRTGQAVYKNGFADSQWARFLPPGHVALESVLFAPLQIGELTVGLLGLADKAGGFTDDDLRIASAFGELAALALFNARSLASLRGSEERFRAITQTASDAIVTATEEGRVAFWNRAASKMFGYAPEEVIGKPLDLIMPEQFHGRHQAGMQRVTAGGESRLLGNTVEMMALRRDGRAFPVELSLSRWASGEGTFFTGIIRDISDRAHAEDARRESEAKWRSLVDNAPNYITIVNREGIIEFINHAVPGLSPADVVGSSTYDFVQPEYRGLARKKIEDVFRSGETDRFASAAVGPDGSVAWYDNHLGPIKVGDQVTAVTLIATDTTEQVRSAEVLRGLAQHLDQRVKELNCLYGISSLLQRPGISTDEVLQGTVDLIPSAWRCPDITCVRITYGDQTFSTPGFAESAWMQSVDIRVGGEGIGVLQVSYLEERASGAKSPFLPEERDLLEAIAEQLGRILEWYQTQEQLKDQNQFITTAIESLAHPFYVVDATDYTVKMANSAARVGDWPEPVTCYALTHRRSTPCDGKEHLCPLQEIKRTCRPALTQHTHYDREGNPRFYEVRGYPILDQVGEVSQIIEYTLDITERVRADQEIESLSRFPSENPNPVLRLTGAGKVAYANEAALPLLETWRCQVDQVLPDAWRALITKVLRSSRSRDVEVTVEDRVFSLNFAPVGDGGYVNVYGLDITDRVQAEEALQRAHDDLELRVQERTAALAAANDELRAARDRNGALYAAERQARHTAETLSMASRALTETLDLQAVMDTLLNYLQQLVPYQSAWFALPRDEYHLVVRSSRDYERWMDQQKILGFVVDAREHPQVARLLSSKRSILIADTGKDAEWQHPVGAKAVRNWLGVPLVADDRVIGVCGLDKAEPGFFTRQHVQLAEALVGQAALAIENAWLFERVRAGQERLRELSRRLVEVQENERRYIARELHDEAGQALVSLMVGLRLLERGAQDPEALVTRVAELKQMVDGVLDNLHRLAADLRPVSLDHLGLVPALRQQVQAIREQHGLAVQFEAAGFAGRLSPEEETALYRIVQEALNNVIRHAQATRVDVLLRPRGDELIVMVEDDGVGFDPAAATEGGHLGLLSMRERAEMLGGRLVVESRVGAGTTVLVEVPYGNSNLDRG